VNIVVITALFAFALAFILGLALGFFKQFFAMEEDQLTGQIRAILPGANCGACGFAGCDGYASAVANRKTGISGCSAGGQKTALKLSALVGGEANVKPKIAFLACRGTAEKAVQKGIYQGVKSCRASKLSTGSIKNCTWGCQGFGDCVKVCKFGAISMGSEGLPVIDFKKCTGCRACSIECPQHIIRIISNETNGVIPVCSNLNVLKTQVSKNCKNGCIKCELCVKNCPLQCIKMNNGIPAVDYSVCTACGICAEKCPVKVMAISPLRF